MDTDLTSLADDDRVALLGGTAPDRAQRRRRASLVLLMAAVAGAVTVAFVACSASVASAASSAPRSSGEGPVRANPHAHAHVSPNKPNSTRV